MPSPRWIRAAGALGALALGCVDMQLGAVPRPPLPHPALEVPLEAPPPDPLSVAAPEGAQVEAVVTDLTYPSSVELDGAGNLYVAEAGAIAGDLHAPARVLRIAPDGEVRVLTDGLIPPVTDLLWHEGRLLVSHRGRISEIAPDGELRDIVTDLPSLGDHSNGQLAIGPDGWLYVGQGTATNSGVVGVDNFLLGWLPRQPRVHDRSPRTVELRRRSFGTLNPFVLGGAQGSVIVTTGGFAPFGEETPRALGHVKGNGAIYRMRLDGSGLEVFAWGLRNPLGLQWSPDGELYAAEDGFDERGSRPIAGDPDDLHLIREGAWYGWPDYAAGEPVTDERFAPEDGPAPKLLLERPPARPEKPYMTFPPHAGVAKLAFDREGTFGPPGTLLLACFGPLTPFSGEPRADAPKPAVLRIDLARREAQPLLESADDFRSGVPSAGLRRPVDVVFAPDGKALYVVDAGVVEVLRTPVPLPEPRPGTGVVWRVTPRGVDPQGPPAGITVLPGRGRVPERGTLPAAAPRGEREGAVRGGAPRQEPDPRGGRDDVQRDDTEPERRGEAPSEGSPERGGAGGGAGAGGGSGAGGGFGGGGG